MTFTFIGPLPFIEISDWRGDHRMLVVSILAGVVGFAVSLISISSFARARVSSIRIGFAQNDETRLLLTGARLYWIFSLVCHYYYDVVVLFLIIYILLLC